MIIFPDLPHVEVEGVEVAEQITALHKQGMKSAEIAAIVGIAERTVRQWLSRGDVPYAGPRKARSSPLDPYKPYLVERW